jgi:hypothetical protein
MADDPGHVHRDVETASLYSDGKDNSALSPQPHAFAARMREIRENETEIRRQLREQKQSKWIVIDGKRMDREELELLLSLPVEIFDLSDPASDVAS